MSRPRNRSFKGLRRTRRTSSASNESCLPRPRSSSRRRSSAANRIASSRAMSARANGSSTKSSRAGPRHSPSASRSSATSSSGGRPPAIATRSSNRVESTRPARHEPIPGLVRDEDALRQDLPQLGDVGLYHLPGADGRVLPELLDQSPTRHRAAERAEAGSPAAARCFAAGIATACLVPTSIGPSIRNSISRRRMERTTGCALPPLDRASAIVTVTTPTTREAITMPTIHLPAWAPQLPHQRRGIHRPAPDARVGGLRDLLRSAVSHLDPDLVYCVSLDLPGHGDPPANPGRPTPSTCSPTPPTAVADASGADTFVLLGFSMSAKFAQYVALRHPDRTLGQILVPGAPPTRSPYLRTCSTTGTAVREMSTASQR